MALDDEKRAELEDAVTEMRMLAEMMATDGWQKVIVPGFVSMRNAYRKKLMAAETLPEMFKAQGAVKSIDMFLSDEERKIESDIDHRIREGQEAVEILSKEKPEEDEETDTG